MTITLLGYLCRDRNILPTGQSVESTGGKGLFTAAALARSGVTANLITWLPDADQELLRALDGYGVRSFRVPLSVGTVNTNVHHDDTTTATTAMDPHSIVPDDLTEPMRDAIRASSTVLLAPDLQKKISLETIQFLHDDMGKRISADVGKYFRILNEKNELIPRYPWPDGATYLKYFSTVFVSREDIEPMLDAFGSLEVASKRFAEMGPREIIITLGRQGVFLFSKDENQAFSVPAYPPAVIVDPTGAGDTFMGAYCGWREQGHSVEEAGRFAAVAASLKLSYTGPLRESAGEIERFMKD